MAISKVPYHVCMGEQLELDDVGSFQVKWHLAQDLKSLTSMLGVQFLIYCMRLSKENEEALDLEWAQSVLSCPQGAMPNRHEDDPHWSAILTIPLHRVHVCTLHTEIRIIDQLSYLNTIYAWTM